MGVICITIYLNIVNPLEYDRAVSALDQVYGSPDPCVRAGDNAHWGTSHTKTAGRALWFYDRLFLYIKCFC